MINLNDVTLVSHSRQNNFWGETFRFSIHDNYKIQTNLYSLNNQSGVSGILNQLSGFKANDFDYQPVILNNSFVGFGKIENITFAESVDVRLRPATIDLIVYNSGNLNLINNLDPVYSGINFNNSQYPVYLIENFSEDFNSEVSEDGTYSEQQKIQMKFVSGAAIGTAQNPLAMAENFSYNLLNDGGGIGFINNFYSGWRLKPGRRFYTEIINAVDNSYSVTQSFKTLRDISGTYSINYTNSLQINENGISTVTERGKVQGLFPDSFGNYYPAAISGEQYEVQNFSFSRCNDVFNNYSNSSYPLSSRRITYGQILNQFIDSVQYEVSFSNDPKINNLFSWEYTQVAEREKTECTYKITEEGTIQGFSTDCTPAQKYNNALAGFVSINTGIYNRCYNFYTGFSMFANPIKIINQGYSEDKIRGVIKYNETFTDNLIYSYSGCKKLILNIVDDFSTPGKNLFGIPGALEIAQPNNIVTLAKRNLTLEILGFRGTALTGYLNLAISMINNNVPSGVDPYIADLNYQWNPRLNQFNLTNAWNYYENIDLSQFLIT